MALLNTIFIEGTLTMNTAPSNNSHDDEQTNFIIVQDGFLAAEWEIAVDKRNEPLQGNTDGRSYGTFRSAARELCNYLDGQIEQAQKAKAMLLSCKSFEDYEALEA